MATLNLHDLQFILTQIKLSEQHAAGTPLSALIGNPLLPYGVRTVDGSYNNIVDGREFWGAADQPFARLLDMYAEEGDLMRTLQSGIRVAAYANAEAAEVMVRALFLADRFGC